MRKLFLLLLSTTLQQCIPRIFNTKLITIIVRRTLTDKSQNSKTKETNEAFLEIAVNMYETYQARRVLRLKELSMQIKTINDKMKDLNDKIKDLPTKDDLIKFKTKFNKRINL